MVHDCDKLFQPHYFVKQLSYLRVLIFWLPYLSISKGRPSFVAQKCKVSVKQCRSCHCSHNYLNAVSKQQVSDVFGRHYCLHFEDISDKKWG